MTQVIHSVRFLFSRAWPVILAMSAACLCVTWTAPAAWAQKNKPGGTTYKYTLTDLLGFPDHGYQSRAQFVTKRSTLGQSLVLGISRLYPDPQGPAVFHPAVWHITSNGGLSAGDPADLGLPSFALEVDPMGINGLGFVLGRPVRSAMQDELGNYVFRSYVDVPAMGVRPLPGVANDNSTAAGINDAGAIVGTVEVFTNDPQYPQGIKGEGALWYVDVAGTVTGPVLLGDFVPSAINNYGVMAGVLNGYPAVARMVNATLVIDRTVQTNRFLGAHLHAINDYPADDPRLTVVGDSFRNELGQYNTSDSQRGVAWRPYAASNATTVLGTLGGNYSNALSVNRSGQIVGDSSGKRGGQFAFVYSNGVMTNLNTITNVGDASLQSAVGINDDGDIVGFMQIPRPVSEQHGFVLRPIVP
jgi:probable HAF family extracellular repeat protein